MPDHTMSHTLPCLKAERDAHVRAIRDAADRSLIRCYALQIGGFIAFAFCDTVGLVRLFMADARLECLCWTAAGVVIFRGLVWIDSDLEKAYQRTVRRPRHVFCPSCRAHLPTTMPWHCARCGTVNEGHNFDSYLNGCGHCDAVPRALICPRCRQLISMSDGFHGRDIACAPIDTVFRDDLVEAEQSRESTRQRIEAAIHAARETR